MILFSIDATQAIRPLDPSLDLNMFIRHSAAIKMIVKSGPIRRRRAASNNHGLSSSSSQHLEQPNKNQALHRGLEQLQKRPGQSSPSASSSTAAAATVSAAAPYTAYTIANKPTRLDRLNQAAINAACSFLVVLLAAQSYKAGAERRRALDHLEAATEVLKETQGRLKQLVDPATAEEIAAACQSVIILQQQQRNNKKDQAVTTSWDWVWSRTQSAGISDRTTGQKNDNDDNVVKDEVQQQLSEIIHAKLRSMIDPKIALDEEDRDKELVRELVKTIEPPTRKQVFTI